MEFSGQVVARLVSPPGQYLPASHTLHGVVPDTVPDPRYPGLHLQSFWTPESAGECVLVGQPVMDVPAQ